MSGHSHFKSIKYKKGIEDAKRARIFSKLSRLISITARDKGGDPETNSALRMAIEKAKAFNMPQENIERAIKRGTGVLGGEMKLENLVLEGIAPNGVGIVMEAVTDNRNRTLAEIRHILERGGGKLASGGVLWMFKKKGCITIDPKQQSQDLKKEDLELIAIESGAEDIKWSQGLLEVYTPPEQLEKVKEDLEKKNIKIDEVSLDWVPKEEIELKDEESKQRIMNLFEALDEHPDIQEIYSNLKM